MIGLWPLPRGGNMHNDLEDGMATRYTSDQDDPLTADARERIGVIDESETPSSGATLELAGLNWAIGLEWQVSDNQKSSLREARSEARILATDPKFNYDADLICVASTSKGIRQFGFGNTERGHTSGQAALAPIIAFRLDQDGGNVIAVIKIDQNSNNPRWWIVAVVNGGIYADTLAADEAEAHKVCQGLANDAIMLWKDIHAPLHWGFGQHAEWTVESIAYLPENSLDVPVTLQPVYGVAWYLSHYLGANGGRFDKKQIGMACAAFLLLGGMYGYSWYQDYLEEQRFEELRRAAELRAQGKATPLAPVRDPVWAKKPLPSEVIANCMSGVSAMWQKAPGWDQKKIICGEATVTAEFAKETGSISGLVEVANTRDWPAPSFDDAGSNASITIALPQLKERGPEALLPPEFVKPVVADFFQRSGHTITASEQPGFFELTWQTVTLPADWASALDVLPGTTINRIEFDPMSNVWGFNAFVYAWQPPPPPPETS